MRGRAVPAPLAWLGLAASVLLVILLPVQIVLGAGGILAIVPWLPMLVFEVAIATWFLVRGVRPRIAA